MEETSESLMIEIQDGLKRLEASLPKRVDGFAISPDSKLPSKVLSYRAALMWRMAELVRCALNHFAEGDLASAMLLTRAALENSAANLYLHEKVLASVQSGTLGDIDEYLMKLLMGSKNKNDSGLPQAVNVLTFVSHADKEIDGLGEQYDNLCEFSHPNWAGTSLLYAKPDADNLWTDFGVNVRGAKGPRNGGIANLSGAMLAFEVGCNRIGRDIDAFIAICERPQAA
jgi:hypothetical protein